MKQETNPPRRSGKEARSASEYDIRQSTFVTSVAAYAEFEGADKPEIVVAGKSNVGKSSLINSLCRNNKLARVSGAPGKTRLLNIFLINGSVHLVDLPGYGYAKAPKTEIERWGKRVETYLSKTQNLKQILHLVDIRHDPTQDDIMMNGWLRSTGLPFKVIATKADKISRGARMRYIAAICRKLVVQPWEVIPYSSEDGTGREELLAVFQEIEAHIE